ncbi:MAG: DUF6382 domain-containing protein [Bacillota bacterium]
MEKTLMGFNAEITGGAGTRYLVLTRPGLHRNEIGFEAEMIANNVIPGIVALDIREKDSITSLRYHIGGLTTLTNYFKKKKVCKDEFIGVLDRLLAVLLDCGKYFLHDSSLVLDENFVYIDSRSREVFFLYIPVEISRDTAGAVKLFVVNLMVSTGSLETEETWTRQILSLVKADGFNLTCFRQSLRALKDGHGCLHEDLPQDSCAGSAIYNAKENSQPEVRNLSPESVYRHEPDMTGPETTDLAQNESRRLAKRKTLLVFVAAISLAAGILTNIDLRIVKSIPLIRLLLTGPGYFYLGGIALILGILTVLPHRLKRRDKREPAGTALTSSRDKPEEAVHNKTLSAGNITSDGTFFVPGSDPDETALLEECGYPRLYSLNSAEVIVIDKTRFTVGRNKDTCDYTIDNKSIGRIHAQIEEVDGAYFITDLDTKNGTFINGASLLSNKTYQLNNHDRVSFANLDYCFKIN